MPSHSPAQQRYNRRILALSLFYAVSVIAAVWLFRHASPSGPLAWGLAILPALPLVGIFIATGRYLIEEKDEYLRAVETRKSLIASGFMLSATVCLGFLQSFQLIANFHFFWVAALWFGGLCLGGCVTRLAR